MSPQGLAAFCARHGETGEAKEAMERFKEYVVENGLKERFKLTAWKMLRDGAASWEREEEEEEEEAEEEDAPMRSPEYTRRVEAAVRGKRGAGGTRGTREGGRRGRESL
jgi:hypothetical protein